MYQMVPLYVLGTKIYHFPTKFLQIEQISDLESIDNKSDIGLYLSAQLIKAFGKVANGHVVVGGMFRCFCGAHIYSVK
jgi:hypothetical protein